LYFSEHRELQQHRTGYKSTAGRNNQSTKTGNGSIGQHQQRPRMVTLTALNNSTASGYSSHANNNLGRDWLPEHRSELQQHRDWLQEHREQPEQSSDRQRRSIANTNSAATGLQEHCVELPTASGYSSYANKSTRPRPVTRAPRTSQQHRDWLQEHRANKSVSTATGKRQH
jgi:uncharacterized protein YciI